MRILGEGWRRLGFRTWHGFQELSWVGLDWIGLSWCTRMRMSWSLDVLFRARPHCFALRLGFSLAC